MSAHTANHNNSSDPATAPTSADSVAAASVPAPASPAASARRARPIFQMRDIVLMVTLAVVFGFLYWVLVQAWNVLTIAMGPAGDLSQHLLFGGWLIVAPIALAIIRRPGVGIIAEMVAAAIEVFFLGSPIGPTLLIAAFLQGFGSEAAFAITRYRRFTWGVYAVSGLLGAAIVFFYSAFRSGWFGQDIFWLRFAIQCGSGVILGGLLAKVIVDALVRTGVLNNYAIVREAAV